MIYYNITAYNPIFVFFKFNHLIMLFFPLFFLFFSIAWVPVSRCSIKIFGRTTTYCASLTHTP